MAKQSKDKPAKRKPATVGQMQAWLKKAGRPVATADKVKNKDDLIKLHKAEK